MDQHTVDSAKNVTDVAIIAGTLGFVMEWLPLVVGVATLILTIVRIVIEGQKLCPIIARWYTAIQSKLKAK